MFVLKVVRQLSLYAPRWAVLMMLFGAGINLYKICLVQGSTKDPPVNLTDGDEVVSCLLHFTMFGINLLRWLGFVICAFINYTYYHIHYLLPVKPNLFLHDSGVNNECPSLNSNCILETWRFQKLKTENQTCPLRRVLRVVLMIFVLKVVRLPHLLRRLCFSNFVWCWCHGAASVPSADRQAVRASLPRWAVLLLLLGAGIILH